MKKSVAVVALALSFASAGAFAESFTGVVADSMCASNAAKASTPEHAACAAKCIKGGSAPVLVVGDKVYKIENQESVAKHIGHKVDVMGTLNGDTIHIDKVTM